MKNDQLEEAAKVAIIASATTTSSPFKTAFKATLGFYVAQTLLTLVGIGVFAAVIAITVYFVTGK